MVQKNSRNQFSNCAFIANTSHDNPDLLEKTLHLSLPRHSAQQVLPRCRMVSTPGTASKTTRIKKLSDSERMRDLVSFTFKTYEGDSPNPFGCDIINTKTDERLVRCVNGVGIENDPSSHGEVRAMRLGCKKLKTPSLRGYTLFTTCEPCPMCMSMALWAGVDRVVYGATIDDAARHCFQIYLSAREVAAKGDMPRPVVTGPIEQELAYSLFTHPKMLAAFRVWMKGKRRKLVT